MSDTSKPMHTREEKIRLVKWIFGQPLIFVITALILFIIFVPVLLLTPEKASSFIFGIEFKLIVYAVNILVTVVIVNRFLKFPFRKMISYERPFSFRYLAIGFFPIFILLLGTAFIEKTLRPDDYAFSLRQGWPVDFLLTFVFVVPAALFEELLFRAYVAYFLKDRLEKRPLQKLFYCLASASFFAVLHVWNPEVRGSGAVYAMLFYFSMGFALMAIYLRTEGIEASWGLHVANNLVAAWFFSYEDSVLVTNAVFTKKGGIDGFSLLGPVICITISTLIIVVCSRKKPSLKKDETI